MSIERYPLTTLWLWAYERDEVAMIRVAIVIGSLIHEGAAKPPGYYATLYWAREYTGLA